MPSAGTILAAAQRLSTPGGQRLWTDAQVAFLVKLAFEAGAAWHHLGDIEEMHDMWASHPVQRPTPGAWYRRRLDDMREAFARFPLTRGRSEYPGGPVDFDTGQPVTP